MRINANNFYGGGVKSSFGANDKAPKNNNYAGYYAAWAAAGLLSVAGMYKCGHDTLEQSRENINKICDKAELMLELDQVRHDTFMLEDVNGDCLPELILYKPDGSKVVLDIQDSKKL